VTDLPATMTYSEVGDLKAVRDFVAARAASLGLPPVRVELLILAVSELTTNTLQHTDGAGRIHVWVRAGQLICDVVDSGPMRTFGRDMPAAGVVGGRGLAIVERICDDVETFPVEGGTMVRIRLDL
jgi:serine/threonine-protein kinase RsbW